VEQAAGELEPGGRIVWIMESTTGWSRVKDLLGDRAEFVLANVLQMPLPPKGKRRKTDKIDTARMLRAMKLSPSDQSLVELKVQQLEQLAKQLEQVETRMQTIYKGWPEAQWVDEVRGMGMVTAVSLLAHIGPIGRFATAGSAEAGPTRTCGTC